MKHVFLKVTAVVLYFYALGLHSQEADSSISTQIDSGASSARAISSSVGLSVGDNYILKPSDVVQVEVYQEPDLNKQSRIEGDGTVSLPLVGKVRVAGMMLSEAQSLVTDLYNRDFLVDPQVSLFVVDFSPKFVRVLGSVGRPGYVAIPPDKTLTLIDAMTQCGDVTRLGNGKRMTVTRTSKDGTTQSFEVNFDKIKKGEAKDYTLQEGDTIFVPEILI